MNETMKSLLTRRSIRSFETRQVPDDLLQQIVEAGRYAATGMGRQPWHFTVVQNRALLDWIVAENVKAILASGNERTIERAKDPNYDNFYHAPTVIVVSGTGEGSIVIADCANAMQNMAVAAHSLGLGSCYLASFSMAFRDGRMPELAQRLGVPEGFTPMFALAVGYAAGPAPEPAPRKDNVNYIR
ncbi:MAG: nitroreductase family protein [Chloroflexota bacterium]|jgi:nitroreductase